MWRIRTRSAILNANYSTTSIFFHDPQLTNFKMYSHLKALLIATSLSTKKQKIERVVYLLTIHSFKVEFFLAHYPFEICYDPSVEKCWTRDLLQTKTHRLTSILTIKFYFQLSSFCCRCAATLSCPASRAAWPASTQSWTDKITVQIRDFFSPRCTTRLVIRCQSIQ